MDIRIELRKLRKYREVSATTMAEKIDMSVNTIQAMENLRMQPNLKTVIKIADFLGYELKLQPKA
jgi:DNA-binding XRE family transcriptional regulator